MNEELSQKLKREVIRLLKRGSHQEDYTKPYLFSPNGQEKCSWSKRDIVEEIENETEFGMDFLAGMITLAIDLTMRGKA